MKMEDYVFYSRKKLLENIKNKDFLINKICSLFFKEDYESISFVASGSSYNSILMVTDALQELIKVPIYLKTPEYVLQFGLPNEISTFPIVVSQSGASTNIIDCLKYLRERNIFEISLSGNVESQMSRYSSVIIDYGPGNEYIDYVTTGVQTLVEFILLFAYKVSEKLPREKEMFLSNFKDTILYQQKLLKITELFINENYFELSMKNPTFFCGNGPNYGVAKEGALKFQETLKRPAMYYELEEFLHGPDMQLTPNHTVFLLDDNRENTKSRFYEVYLALKKITSNVFFITDNKEVESEEHILQTKECPDWILSPYYSLTVVQLIAAKMSEYLKTWDTHPYFDLFEEDIDIKTKDYEQQIINIKKKWDSEQ